MEDPWLASLSQASESSASSRRETELHIDIIRYIAQKVEHRPPILPISPAHCPSRIFRHGCDTCN